MTRIGGFFSEDMRRFQVVVTLSVSYGRLQTIRCAQGPDIAM